MELSDDLVMQYLIFFTWGGSFTFAPTFCELPFLFMLIQKPI